MTSANDAPTLTGDAGSVQFTEGTPVIIDNNLVLADVDSANLNGATVKITNYKAGDQLLFTPTAGISITGTATGVVDTTANTLTLTLTGADTVEAYEAALRSIRFNNTSENPDATTRTIEWNVTDVSADSSQAQSLASAGSSEVTIVAVNDAPVLTGGGNTIQFSEGDPAVVLDNAITLSDHEGSAATTVTVQLAGATGVTITNSEILEFDATASTKVTGALSNNNQTLTITQASGVTDAANSDFQALLRTVKYKNTDTATADGNRTITFSAVETANGQNFTSADIVTTVSVAALNDDAPVLGGARSDATNYAKSADAAKFTEAGTAVVLESGLTVADSDHANLDVSDHQSERGLCQE